MIAELLDGIVALGKLVGVMWCTASFCVAMLFAWYGLLDRIRGEKVPTSPSSS